MSLKALPGGNEDKGLSAPSDGPRILASGAPPSPGPIPNHLAAHLRFGEALVWWGVKDSIAAGPILIALGAALLALLLVTGFAPEFWTGPLSGVWPPIAALLSPTAFVLVREWMSRRAVLVTDNSIVEVDRSDSAQRLGFINVLMVRRDGLRGGLRLRGRRAEVLIPAALADDARAAIASQLRDTVRGDTDIDDPLGWMP